MIATGFFMPKLAFLTLANLRSDDVSYSVYLDAHYVTHMAMTPS